MSGTTTKTVAIRLPIDTADAYDRQAEAAGVNLSTYLRRRLQTGDEMLAQVAQLRSQLTDLTLQLATISPSQNDKPASDAGMLAEIILLLRYVAPNDRVQIVHGELKRKGLTVWQG